MSMRRFGLLVLVVVILVAATSSAAPTAVRSFPQISEVRWSPSGDWLAFTVDDGGSGANAGLNVIRADRSDAHHFGVGNLDPESLEWSPRGTRLAVSNADTTWVVSPGRAVIQLEGWFGDWSPDGSKILLVRPTGTAQNPRSIWVANAKTGAARYLTDGEWPRWSPDGRQIAFSLIVRWSSLFCVEAPLDSIAPDGADRRPLAAEPQGYRSQIASDWSPNGARVAFTEAPGGVECDGPLRAILAAGDGSLKTHVIGQGRARWLPGGRHLALQSQNVLSTLRIVKPSGRTVAKFDAVSDYSPSADGRRIVFSEPGRVIWIAGIDGKGRHRLGGGDHPSWSSRNWIAFSAMGSCGRQRVERVFVVRPNGKHRHALTRC